MKSHFGMVAPDVEIDDGKGDIFLHNFVVLKTTKITDIAFKWMWVSCKLENVLTLWSRGSDIVCVFTTFICTTLML